MHYETIHSAYYSIALEPAPPHTKVTSEVSPAKVCSIGKHWALYYSPFIARRDRTQKWWLSLLKSGVENNESSSKETENRLIFRCPIYRLPGRPRRHSHHHDTIISPMLQKMGWTRRDRDHHLNIIKIIPIHLHQRSRKAIKVSRLHRLQATPIKQARVVIIQIGHYPLDGR